MHFDNELSIPDIPGSVLHIKSEDMKRKREAAQQILEFISKYSPEEDDPSRKPYEISILIMIPNGLISMIIGTKGRQICNLIKDSKADIVVNQPIYKMVHRTINIGGKPSHVAEAIKSIYNIMEERFYEVSKVEMECKPLNVNTTQTHVNLIFSLIFII
jgi:polyribonucleotide nucleotidyltransferase